MEEEERDEDEVRPGGQQAAEGQMASLIRSEVKELQRKSKRPRAHPAGLWHVKEGKVLKAKRREKS